MPLNRQNSVTGAVKTTVQPSWIKLMYPIQNATINANNTISDKSNKHPIKLSLASGTPSEN